ncbi:MAG TPA: DNA-directed RNA polymerase subunit alpha [Candidatus Bipolaricaulota bacterium]|nr:DNA-directed RNA polymerase subunit alpha [Candidatus Bipolaricaulota bacterium]
MESLLLPSKIQYQDGAEENQATLTIEPMYMGYGTTIGNALRRVLLSSLPGAAATAVKIKGVDQEFSAIKNVKENALEVCLNLKLMRLKVFSEEPQKLTLKVKGKKEITAADIDKNAQVEIINQDLHIASLTDKDSELEMEITVSQGRGYLATEERSKEDLEIGTILIDALFSPLKNIGFKREDIRVGDITNYDKLVMDIETDGTISPKEAVKAASQILIDHLNLLVGEKTVEPVMAEASVEEVPAEVEEMEEVEEKKPKKKSKKDK